MAIFWLTLTFAAIYTTVIVIFLERNCTQLAEDCPKFFGTLFYFFAYPLVLLAVLTSMISRFVGLDMYEACVNTLILIAKSLSYFCIGWNVALFLTMALSIINRTKTSACIKYLGIRFESKITKRVINSMVFLSVITIFLEILTLAFSTH